MKAWAGEQEGGDNARVLHYLATVTAEPALVHGIEADVGSLRPVVWPTSSCGGPPRSA
jgi:urease alpha subunit